MRKLRPREGELGHVSPRRGGRAGAGTQGGSQMSVQSRGSHRRAELIQGQGSQLSLPPRLQVSLRACLGRGPRIPGGLVVEAERGDRCDIPTLGCSWRSP